MAWFGGSLYHSNLVPFLPLVESGGLMQLTKATLERSAASGIVRELARRIEAEYAEMPGLSVTLSQAQRLWAIDRHTCQTVFDRLIAPESCG